MSIVDLQRNGNEVGSVRVRHVAGTGEREVQERMKTKLEHLVEGDGSPNLGQFIPKRESALCPVTFELQCGKGTGRSITRVTNCHLVIAVSHLRTAVR